jgi:hypothetical protein
MHCHGHDGHGTEIANLCSGYYYVENQFGMSLLQETFLNSDSQSVRFRTPESELELRYRIYPGLWESLFGNVSELRIRHYILLPCLHIQ